MDKKFFGVIAFILMVSFTSAVVCEDTVYDSGWLDFGDYMSSHTGDAGDSSLGEGVVYVDNAAGEFVIETPELNFAGDYAFAFRYYIGTGNDNDTEDFKVSCGSEEFYFEDSIYGDNPKIVETTIHCNLEEGKNQITFTSTDIGSVQFYEFGLDSLLECPEPVCGNGELEVGEFCDEGYGNLNGCLAGYGETCTYCSLSCQLEEEIGGYCGDGVCSIEENYSTCLADCPMPKERQTKIIGHVYFGNLSNLISNATLEITCDNEFNQTLSQNGAYQAIFNEECENVSVFAKKDHYNGLEIGKAVYLENLDSFFLQLDVGMFQEPYCGDNICNNNETSETCSEDCPLERSSSSRQRYSSITQLENDCEPSWSCSGFSECYDGMRTRNCVDSNNCAVSYNKPVENVGCQIVESSLEERNAPVWAFITGGLALVLAGLFIASKGN